MTKHGRVLLCMAHDPGVRLRDIAARVGITERSAFGIVSDLARRRASGTDGLSRLRGNAGAMSTAMGENQAGGHALLR